MCPFPEHGRSDAPSGSALKKSIAVVPPGAVLPLAITGIGWFDAGTGGKQKKGSSIHKNVL